MKYYFFPPHTKWPELHNNNKNLIYIQLFPLLKMSVGSLKDETSMFQKYPCYGIFYTTIVNNSINTDEKYLQHVFLVNNPSTINK